MLAVPVIERVLQSDPTDETAYRALMRALAAAGRREDALRQYERCAASLRDDLGIDPGEETEALAEELKDRGITVNALLPSIIDTPPNRADMPKADFGKWVQPAQLADAIVFLLSPKASAITGALIPVTGRV